MKQPFAKKFIPKMPGQMDVGDTYARKKNAEIEPVQKRKKEAAEADADAWIREVKARPNKKGGK